VSAQPTEPSLPLSQISAPPLAVLAPVSHQAAVVSSAPAAVGISKAVAGPSSSSSLSISAAPSQGVGLSSELVLYNGVPSQSVSEPLA
jgi:hypothetical protein